MIFRSFLVGLLTSAIVMLPLAVQPLEVGWIWPFLVLGIALIALLLQKYVLGRKGAAPSSYAGIPDLVFHIHAPSSPDSPLGWSLRGWISGLLAVFGGMAGPEGSAIEFSQALFMNLRSRSSRWFEQRRRTDVGCAIAASVSAAFGAPFAAVLLPLELGIGGSTISSAISALAAFIAMHSLNAFGEFTVSYARFFADVAFLDSREWLAVALIAAFVALLGALLVKFIRLGEESLSRLLPERRWLRPLVGGILLVAVLLAFPKAFTLAPLQVRDALAGKLASAGLGPLLVGRVLILASVLVAFGTAGIFWPLFLIGALAGMIVNAAWLGSLAGFSAVAAIVGASALWSVVLGTPVAAAVLALELTHNYQVLLPCLLAGWLAKYLASGIFRISRSRSRTLIEQNLEARGLRVAGGRSIAVLEGLRAKDAMVTDFEAVHEQEPISEIYLRLSRSHYPFFPVLNSKHSYAGLLTLDMIQDAWHTDSTVSSHSSLSKLLEVKDLLYRSGFRVGTIPTLAPEQRLSEISSLLERFPCLPILGEEGRVLGLLLASNVRLAYDREVARRSLESRTP